MDGILEFCTRKVLAWPGTMPIDQWLTNPLANGKFRGWDQKNPAGSKKGIFLAKSPDWHLIRRDLRCSRSNRGELAKFRLEIGHDQVPYNVMDLSRLLFPDSMRFCLVLAVLFASVGAPRPIVHDHQQLDGHAEPAEHFEIHWAQYHQADPCQPTGPHCHWILGHAPIAGVTPCGDPASFVCISAQLESTNVHLHHIDLLPISVNWGTVDSLASGLACRRIQLQTREYPLGPPWSTASARLHSLLARFTI